MNRNYKRPAFIWNRKEKKTFQPQTWMVVYNSTLTCLLEQNQLHVAFILNYPELKSQKLWWQMSRPVKDTTDTPTGNIMMKACTLCFSLVILERQINETVQLPGARKTYKWFTLTEHNNNYSFCQIKKQKTKCLTYESRVQISNSVEISKHLETVRQHDDLLHGELETIVFIWTKTLSWHLHTLNCVSVILFSHYQRKSDSW